MQDWIQNKRRGTKLSEDELTSCIFGPLRYMEPAQAWKACQMLCGPSDGDQGSDPEPTHVRVRIWPRFPRNDRKGRYVEPDAQILAWNGDALLGTILVEVKWESGLQENQLLDQWRFIAADDKFGADVRDCSTHILLGRRPSREALAIDKQKLAAREEHIEWGDRLTTLSWFQVSTRLLGLRSSHGSIETWRKDVIAFLAHHGVVAFDGFAFDRLERLSLVGWRFEARIAPELLSVGLLSWSFDGGSAA